MLGLGAAGAPAGAAQASPTYLTRARFLARFIQHTTWPEAAFEGEAGPLVLGIVGRDPFEGSIDLAVRGQSRGTHAVEVRRLTDLEDVARAHVLFLGRQTPAERAQVLERCRHLPVLVVGDERGLAEGGATLAFYLERGKVRFEASTTAIRRARLDVSSELLKVADIVEERGGDGR